MIARFFGADAATDAFFVAFRLPNLLRRLFSEGAFAQGFVPPLSQHRGDIDSLRRFISHSAGLLGLILFLATLLAMFSASFLILTIAPGFADDASQLDLSARLLRIMLPYMLLIGLTAFASAILNCHAQFAIPAIMPAFLNIAMIAAMLWLSPLLSLPIEALAWGVLLGGFLQLILQLPSLWRLGLLRWPRLDFNDLEVRLTLKKLLPAILGVSSSQLNLLLGTLIASFLASGSISWLYYSDRLVEFPLGVLGVALSTAILPKLSNFHVKESAENFSKSLDLGLRWTLLIALPAALGLILLAEPLMAVLFEGEAFSDFDVKMAGLSLVAYSLGLPGLIGIKVLASGFTARLDFASPLRFGFYSMMISLVLSIGFAFMWAPLGLGHVGIALATALAALANALFLLLRLRAEKILVLQKGWPLYISRLAIANSAMAGLLIYVQGLTELKIDKLLIFIIASIVVYCVSLYMSGLRPVHLSLKEAI